jgi:hypothetical protein
LNFDEDFDAASLKCCRAALLLVGFTFDYTELCIMPVLLKEEPSKSVNSAGTTV